MTGLMVRSVGTIRTKQLAFREVGWQRLGWLERESREVGWQTPVLDSRDL